MAINLTHGRLGLLCLVMLVTVGCPFSRPPSTSNSAKPSDVKFLSLPSSAEEVKFYDSRGFKMAVFKVDEASFRKIFPNARFSEIQKPVSYLTEGYGDLKHLPFERGNESVTQTGLIYENISRGGSGTTILYDRSTGVGFFYWQIH